MQLVRDKIRECGRVIDGHILKVDSFLNHQVDVELMQKVGKEFADYFRGKGITKVITVESSGIAPAAFTALELGVPMIFARKKKSLTLNENLLTAEVMSYTKNETTTITISKDYLSEDDSLLLIDDFLAKGEVVRGFVKLAQSAGAKVVGIGIVIEKSFQSGRAAVEELNIPIYSLARIKSLDNNVVTFMEQD